MEKILSGDEALSGRVDCHCKALVEAGFTGSVLIERDGKVLVNKKYGKAADEDAGKPFYVASLTKQFTAAAIMQLVEKGLIDVEKSINEYLPPELQSDRWAEVTVHHLLSNQSGIHNFTRSPGYEEKTLDLVLDEEKGRELEFAPGSEFEYSNTNYQLLGKIIAHVSQVPYGQYIKEHLLEPAGMNSSRVQSEGEKGPDQEVVQGYKVLRDAAIEKTTAADLHLIYAAGGVISTASDMAKWSDVLDGETAILSKASVKRMTTAYRDQYGYGLCVYDDEERPIVRHAGELAGFNTEFCKYPKQKAVIIVLSNNQNFEVLPLAENLEKIVFDGKMDLAVPVSRMDQDFLDYKGAYQSQQNSDAILRLEVTESGSLQAFFQDSPAFPAFPLSNGDFFVPGLGWEFEKQENGSLLVYVFGRSEPFDTFISSSI